MNYWASYKVLEQFSKVHNNILLRIPFQVNFTWISCLFYVNFMFILREIQLNKICLYIWLHRYKPFIKILRVCVMCTNIAYCRLFDTRTQCLSSISVILYFKLFFSDTVMSQMTLAVHHWFKISISITTFVSLSHYSFMLCALSF